MPEGPTILDVATAQPVAGASVISSPAGTVVTAAGYAGRTYAAEPPEVVRLLADAPDLFLATPSALPGEDVVVHLHAPAGGSLHLVSGHGTSRSHALFDAPPTRASVGDDAPVAAGVDWPGITVRVPDVSSGLWVVELRSASATSQAPLVVRAAGERPRILALASVATWQCYNAWGGRNRYRSFEAGAGSRPASTPSAARRRVSQGLARLLPEIPRTRLKRVLGRDSTRTGWVSRPLSWNRPWPGYIGLDGDPAEPRLNHLAALDRKILHWLDREGYDYECAADVDLQHHPGLAEGRDAVLLLGHSEYWSVPMLDALLASHRRGAWVLNLSGNSLYRTISVAEDHTVRLVDIVTALSGRDETELTGVRFSERAYGTAAPYVTERPTHWVFAGCDVAAGSRFGEECLVDARPDPAARPAYDPSRPTTDDRLLHGSGAAGFEVDRRVRRRREFTVVARGDAPARADMVVKEAHGMAGGAFSASSISFGGSLLVDETCAAIVRNVLQRAGR